jgi:ABC-type bacteriocin/lantibiotic exporter with double-glycine peptidase domain
MSGWAARAIPSVFVCGLALAAEASRVWLDVPFVKQEKNGCGAACIAMVMQYWQHRQRGLPVAPGADEIQRALYSRGARGIYASDMERYLRQHGFRTFAIRGEWTDLRHHLEKGRPLIIALKPGRNDLHYVVLTGLDWQEDIVLKHDPAERKLLKQHRSDFEREWTAAGNWALLAVPEDNRESSSH